jgi:phospholipid/cholesterol/gamma-HCH transport system substrate-binding protein
MKPFTAGVIALVVVAIGTYFAFTHANPFASPYKLNAVFANAENIKPNSPVRIAGVEVGKVTNVEPAGDNSGAARVQMELKNNALPLHQDAEAKIRPRIFLEGNFFVDLKPGSPEGKKEGSGFTIPVNQTASAVQFGQVLSALQTDTRSNLQRFLKEYSTGLSNGGAAGFNQAIRYWTPAYKNGSLMNEASLGTRPHDLSDGVLKGQQKVFKALDTNEESLKSLVTNLNVTFGALAGQDRALEASIPALDSVLKVGSPALDQLNSALPDLRAFSRDALPGVKSSAPTLRASLPFITQARRLVGEAELKGLTRDLVPTIPALAKINHDSIPLLDENRLLSSCQNNVLAPFAFSSIPTDKDTPGADHFGPEGNSGEVYKQLSRVLVGLAGESRIFDSNSPMFRVQAGGGPNTVVETDQDLGQKFFGQSMFPIEATQPAKPSQRPVFRPNVPCETQQAPDLAAPFGGADQSKQAPAVSTSSLPLDLQKVRTEGMAQLQRLAAVVESDKKGDGAPPLVDVPVDQQQKAAKAYGFKWTADNQLEKLKRGGK